MNLRHVTRAAVGLMLLASARGATAAVETYDIDASHTSIVFSVSHVNMSFTYGIFRESQGRFTLDRQNPANDRFQFAIVTNSIDTNQPERDKHLKSPDFFNVQQFPTITFESTSVSQSNSDGRVVFEVAGNLTMHGVTRQVKFPLQMLGEGNGPYGKYRAGFMTQFTLNRSDFGMANLPQFVGDAVGVTISFEGIRQEAGGAARTSQ